MRYPTAMQNSPPLAVPALPDGSPTRKTLTKSFKGVQDISSAFPKLAWRNHIDRRVFARNCMARVKHAEKRPTNRIAGRCWIGSRKSPRRGGATPERGSKDWSGDPRAIVDSESLLLFETWIPPLNLVMLVFSPDAPAWLHNSRSMTARTRHFRLRCRTLRSANPTLAAEIFRFATVNSCHHAPLHRSTAQSSRPAERHVLTRFPSLGS